MLEYLWLSNKVFVISHYNTEFSEN